MLPQPDPSRPSQVLIAGAGPAGARLASDLARAGVPVTLVETLSSADQQAFSSAALPMASAEALRIPERCWATRWNGWQLMGPDGLQHQWWAGNPLGVVLDLSLIHI